MVKNELMAHLGKLVSWYLGVAPTDVWATYSSWEDTESAMLDLIEQMHDEVKPILEERERARK